MRFQLYKIVLLSDIEKAFLQIGLQIPDRDVTRFLWLKNKEKPICDSNIQITRFCRVPFGVISSPFLLGATVDYHLENNASFLAEEIRKGYVDNVLLGAETEAEANEIYRSSKEIFAEASMNLREWTSNSTEFLSSIPEYDHVNPGITKVLGIKWNTTTDMISIQQASTETTERITKREVLRILAQYFDPLGYYLPITVRGKLFLRTLWNDGLHWDDKLSPKQKEQWQILKQDLVEISKHELPRQINPNYGKEADGYLLCFVDASQEIYATAVYLNVCNSDKNSTRLIFAKSRLKPSKAITIPRMELMAILVGVRSLIFVGKELRLTIKQKILWSDLQCALHWIKSSKPLPVFVNNRIIEIRNASGIEFRYVQTNDNPADMATRRKALADLSKVWWEGPEWLENQKSDWPSWNMPTTPEEAVKEITAKEPIVMYEALLACSEDVAKQPKEPYGISENKFSVLNKLLRVTAWSQNISVVSC